MVLVIISILAVLAMPVFTSLNAHAQNVVCLGNLRGLHTSLTACLIDHDSVWPQIPDTMTDDVAISKWWKETLTPYGMTERYLTCPADLPKNDKRKPGHPFESSYVITNFDELPNRAFLWKQPWAIERWENHGGSKGPNMLYPDGSVQRGVSMLTR